MGGKITVYGLALILLIGIVCALPVPDYTLYGSATVNGKTLTKDDSNIITLQVDGKQLANFKMGDVSADAYVLRVPMNDNRTEGFAMTGDSAKIFIDGKEAEQSPVIIGDWGATVKLDISATTGSQPPECIPNWQCDAWSSCGASGTQTRACNDLNNCGIATSKPETSQSCTPKSSGGSSGSGGSSNHNTVSQISKETITVSEKEETPQASITTEATPEPVVAKTTIDSEKTTTEKKNETETINLWQKVLSFFNYGKGNASVTGKAVADAPQAKPLIGILVALVIVVIGLLIAYLVIFRGEEEY